MLMLAGALALTAADPIPMDDIAQRCVQLVLALGEHNGQIDAAAAVAWLERDALTPRQRAEQRVRFFDQYRSYVINYNLGKDLVRRYIEGRGGTEAALAKRWQEFERLLSSPGSRDAGD